MNFYKILLVGIGGFVGSMLRYVSSRSIDEKFNSLVPYGTLTVNIAGSFVLGIIYAWAIRKTGNAENIRLFFGAGFCGGFTTFSAFAFENLNMLEQKLIASSVLYISVSLVLGIVAVFAGMALGKNLI